MEPFLTVRVLLFSLFLLWTKPLTSDFTVDFRSVSMTVQLAYCPFWKPSLAVKAPPERATAPPRQRSVNVPPVRRLLRIVTVVVQQMGKPRRQC